MRTLILALGFVSGAAVGLILAHWLGFDLLGPAGPGGAVAAVAGGLGGGIGLALARSGGHPRRRRK